MATAKEKAIATATEALKASIAAETATKLSADDRNKVARNVWHNVIGLAAIDETFDCDKTWVPLYYGNKPPQGRTMISLRTKVNAVINLSRVDKDRALACWPNEKADYARDGKTVNVNKDWFFRAVTAATADKAAPMGDVIFATRPQKKVDTAGDVAVAIDALINALYKDHKSAFALLQTEAIALGSKIDTLRKAGQLPTADELAAADDATDYKVAA